MCGGSVTTGDPTFSIASDYFERLYEWAEILIRAGHAYVDDQSQEEIRIKRGTLTEPGQNSPFRERSVEQSLDLFRRMKAGEFPNGARVLRAKIDMASGNINLRDPVLYRILHAKHPRTGDKWSIYPSYDYAHGQSDAIEGVTHSICTLEFEDHRPLYEWLLEKLPVPSKPHQYEFARLNLTYTLLSKRVLTELVRGGHVASWDDPRMPTIAGLKRRGVPPAAIREFVKRIGVAKANSVVDVGMLEFCIRELLNKTALRRMAVLRPLKVVMRIIRKARSRRSKPSTIRTIRPPVRARSRLAASFISSATTFMENPPKKFFRLSPGNEVRLRYAYFITCREAVKNAAGEIVELRCTYDPATRGGNAPDGRKVKATMHWLSAAQSIPAEIRVYNQLFPSPGSRMPPISPPISTRNRWRFFPTHGSSLRSPRPIRPIRCSSSAKAISRAIRIQRRIVRSSTERLACATPLPRKLAARADARCAGERIRAFDPFRHLANQSLACFTRSPSSASWARRDSLARLSLAFSSTSKSIKASRFVSSVASASNWR
jgi:glutaminyl-tRNA synthetase